MKIYLRVIYIMDIEAQEPGVLEKLFNSAKGVGASVSDTAKGLTTTVQDAAAGVAETVVGSKSLEQLQMDVTNARSALNAKPDDETLQAALANADAAVTAEMARLAAVQVGGRRRRRSQKQRGGSKRRRSNSGGSRRRRNRKGKKSRRVERH